MRPGVVTIRPGVRPDEDLPMMSPSRFLAALLVALAGVARADELAYGLDVGGLLDLRLAHTGDDVSWFDHGLGKTRYGADDGGDRTAARIAEAALLLSRDFGWATTGHLYLKYDPDQSRPVEPIEAYLKVGPASTSAWRFMGRAGAFFPPISLENTGPAWTSPYAITPSAINTWIGEEVRTIGGEASMQWHGETQRISVGGAAFSMNDPAGALLAWRGWMLHDFKPGLNDRQWFPPTGTVGPGGEFARHAPWLEPFTEVDGRWGYYETMTWEQPGAVELRALRYDNHGDPTEADGFQWSWDTRFTSLGAHARLPHGVDVIAQFLSGRTAWGQRLQVNTDYSSWFLLLSRRYQQHRFSLRYDRFDVEDRADENEYDDHGHAWTLAWGFDLREKQRLMVEWLNVASDHPQRAALGLAPSATENLIQLSYRLYL